MKKVFANDTQLGEYVADQVESLIREKPEALICIAAGTSSFPVFEALIARVKRGSISFHRASFVAMDEWLHFANEEDGSMGDFLKRHFLLHVDFRDVFLFDGMTSDPDAECRRAEAYIAEHGGIDYIVFGIGMNGHFALNEPGASEQERVHTVKVDSITAREGQKYFDGTSAVLTEGITIGAANAAEARKVILMANTASKHDIVLQFESSAPDSSLPSTFLKRDKNFELLITRTVEEG